MVKVRRTTPPPPSTDRLEEEDEGDPATPILIASWLAGYVAG